MPEPKKKKDASRLSVSELLTMARDAVQTRRAALDRQAWYEGTQEEARKQEEELSRIQAEDFSKRTYIKFGNPLLVKRLHLEGIQEKLDEIRQQLPEAEKASKDTRQTADMYMDAYRQCEDAFIPEVDEDDLIEMGRELRILEQQAKERKAEYEATVSNMSKLTKQFEQIEATDYSKKAGAKMVNPDIWKRMELEETQENLQKSAERYPQLKTAAEDAECLAGLFRNTFENSLKTLIKEDKGRLQKLKTRYIKEEMQDTLRKQRELMGEYNWTYVDKEDGSHQEKGLVTHINKLLDSRGNRHSSQEWGKMCEALSKLHIKEVMDEMWDPAEPLMYDKERLKRLREQIDEAIQQTGAYVAKKKDTFLVKTRIGKGAGYLKEARESLQALKKIQECIDTIDKEHERLGKEADQRYRPAIASPAFDSIRNLVSLEPRKSVSREQFRRKESEKNEHLEQTNPQVSIRPR